MDHYDYYVIVDYYYGGEPDNKLLIQYITDSYEDALLKLKEHYKQYTEDKDNFIVRTVEENSILIYKRKRGYLWNSKEIYEKFFIKGYQNKKKE